MKITSCYSVFYASEIEKMLNFLTKQMGFKIAHHRDDGDNQDYYVLKDAAGNSTDIFTSKNYPCKDGFYGIRINVEDFDAAAKGLINDGYKPAFGPIDSESSLFGIYRAPEGSDEPNVVLFLHKR